MTHEQAMTIAEARALDCVVRHMASYAGKLYRQGLSYREIERRLNEHLPMVNRALHDARAAIADYVTQFTERDGETLH